VTRCCVSEARHAHSRVRSQSHDDDDQAAAAAAAAADDDDDGR